jgi:hypothetical protein
LIDADQKEIIEKLKTLGAIVEVLKAEEKIDVEEFTISKYKRHSKKYEKMNLQTVETTVSKKTIAFPAGTYRIEMNQRKSNIILEVLEPEAPNSFVSFGVLKTEEKENLPI